MVQCGVSSVRCHSHLEIDFIPLIAILFCFVMKSHLLIALIGYLIVSILTSISIFFSSSFSPPPLLVAGKAAKQAIDVFTRGKECSVVEKALMRSLNDPEMVAIMIGDIKLSMPGLYQVQRAKKGKK